MRLHWALRRRRLSLLKRRSSGKCVVERLTLAPRRGGTSMRMTQTACRTDVEKFCSRLPQWFGTDSTSAQNVVVTRTPAVVDVMGGACEECGSLVLQGALDVAIAAAAALRSDQQVVICWMSGGEQTIEHPFPIAILNADGPIDAAAFRDAGPFHSAGTQLVLLLLRQLTRAVVGRLNTGITIFIQ